MSWLKQDQFAYEDQRKRLFCDENEGLSEFLGSTNLNQNLAWKFQGCIFEFVHVTAFMGAEVAYFVIRILISI